MEAVSKPVINSAAEEIVDAVKSATMNRSLWATLNRLAKGGNALVVPGSVPEGKLVSDRLNITTPYGVLHMSIDRASYIRLSSSTDRNVIKKVLVILTQAGIIHLPAIINLNTLKFVFNELLT